MEQTPRNYCAMIEGQFKRRVRVVRSDNGMYFMGIITLFLLIFKVKIYFCPHIF